VLTTTDLQILEAYQYCWIEKVARDKQKLPEGDWFVWLIKAGRGFGKTRTGAETIRIWKETNALINLVGATAADVRDIMVEGESGILSTAPYWDRPDYEPSKRKITWNNGSEAHLFSADEPDRLRGTQCNKAWGDEIAVWRYPEAWDMLKLGCRLSEKPQIILTTTPKPTKLMKQIISDPKTLVTSGTTYENKDNLAPGFFDNVVQMYEGTRLGRQEIYAEIIEETEGALWNYNLIEKNRVELLPALSRIVIAIDPAVTSERDSDETGIIVAGKLNDITYILDDLSGIYTPSGWATVAIKGFEKYNADRIIGEANNGGDMIEEILRNINRSISYKKVWASRGKTTRAEPVVSLYEQGKIKHVGILNKLEEEMTSWAAMKGERSPNRVDALVWAVNELMFTQQFQHMLYVPARSNHI